MTDGFTTIHPNGTARSYHEIAEPGSPIAFSSHWMELDEVSPGDERTWLYYHQTTGEIFGCGSLEGLMSFLGEREVIDQRSLDPITRLAFLQSAQACWKEHLRPSARPDFEARLADGTEMRAYLLEKDNRPQDYCLGPEQVHLIQAEIREVPNKYGDTHWFRFKYCETGFLADYGWSAERGPSCYQD